MSEKIRYFCDSCGKNQNETGFKDKGWLHFNRMDQIMYSTGEAYFQPDLSHFDFCSIKCFESWLNSKLA